MKKAILVITLITIMVFLVSCGGGTMENRTVTLETSEGVIKIQMFEDTMPITTGNFIKLVEEGFYDGIKFHRIIGPSKMPPNGFMLQGGDPFTKDDSKQAQWGQGGPGYTIEDEFTTNNKNDPGTISMANAGPNTGGSQFFINLGSNNFLDDKHPVFGKVVEGMDIVTKIGNVQTDTADRPLEAVVITKATVG